jgi:CRISPR system Cascade subunit CasE
MQPLHMVEIYPEITPLMRFLQGQGLLKSGTDEDLGYGIHAWLAAAFGESKPSPWRLIANRHGSARILGYSHHSADELRSRMEEFAEPGVCTICPPSSILSKPMPEWKSGRVLGFDVQCCPVGRKSGSGVEKDLFLIHADAAGDAPLSRETIYCDWATELLERNRAATVKSIKMIGFRLTRQIRRMQSQRAKREQKHPIRPQVRLQGVLTVEEPDAFSSMLCFGIGRHRSFGYGMVLLQPPK